MMGSFQFRPALWSMVLMMFVLGTLAGCRNDSEEPIVLVPENTGPGIAVIAPSNTRLLRAPGQSTSVTLKLLDNEELRLLRIIPLIYNANDELIEEIIPQDIPVEGQSVDYTYQFNAPTLPPFYKIQYVCYVIDLAGLSAETSFWVSIQPDPSAPPPYQTLSYTNDTLYSRLDTAQGPDPSDIPTNSYGFNFSARKALPGEPDLSPGPFRAQMDIAESSFSGQGTWLPTLSSPNHAIFGGDTMIFVMTDTTRFNFMEANYTTIYEAFFSDPAPAMTAPPTIHPIASRNKPSLEVDDVIIVKLIKTPQPQFAVMKVKEVVQEGFGILLSDYIVFDYKVTSP